MRHAPYALVLVVLLLAAAASPAALAQAAPLVGREERPAQPPAEDPYALTMEGLDKLMRGLKGILETLLRYGMPELSEEGDIVIPRVPPGDREEVTPGPNPDGSYTL